jgi:hypothetical protein
MGEGAGAMLGFGAEFPASQRVLNPAGARVANLSGPATSRLEPPPSSNASRQYASASATPVVPTRVTHLVARPRDPLTLLCAAAAEAGTRRLSPAATLRLSSGSDRCSTTERR